MQKRIGNPEYIALGKTVVRVLQPALSNFLDILIINYGQYWIENLEPWDSRRQSLGTYCRSRLQLRWRIDEGEVWQDFRPDEPHIMAEVMLPTNELFRMYLVPDDLQTIQGAIKVGYAPGLSERTLAKAHRILDQGQIRYAFVEAVTAAEIAIHDVIRTSGSMSKDLIDHVQSFYGLPLKAQLAVIASQVGGVTSDDLENAVSAIELRNDIVHEAADITYATENVGMLRALLRVVATLTTAPAFKFPHLMAGNRLYPEDDD